MWETILMSVLLSVATAVIGVVGKAINDWSAREKLKTKAQAQHEARYDMLEALEVGVMNTQEAVVNELKDKAADGKLSKEDIRSIQDTAIREATKIATGPGAELIASTLFDVLASFISGIVNGNKDPKKDSD